MNKNDKTQNKTSILLLSDFHISSKNQNPDVQSIVEENTFITNLAKSVKAHNDSSNSVLKYIFILGDIAYGSWKEEYEVASEKIKELCSKLSVSKKNVFILPGNHDVNQAYSSAFCSDKGIESEDLYKYQEEKFRDFTAFYNNFYDGEVFCPQKVIFRTVKDDKMKVVFLGINTCHKESHIEHSGWIDYSLLSKELDEINNDFADYTIIALMHHRPNDSSSYSNIISNWDDIRGLFEQHKVKIFIFGGYTNDNKAYTLSTKNEINPIICGSIHSLQTTVPVSCMILDYEDEGERTKFNVYPYKYEHNDNIKYWQDQNKDPGAIREIVLKATTGVKEINTQLAVISHDDKDLGLDELGEVHYDYSKAIENKSESLKIAEAFILDVIKDNNLYILGDFHWSKEGQSFTYIIMDYFFDNYRCFSNVKRCYQLLLDIFTDDKLIEFLHASYLKLKDKGDEIETFDQIDQSDLYPKQIIGYEMNGNMVGSILAIMNQYDYTYLPANNRNHTELEGKLPSECAQYKHVIVIVDLIYTKALIKSLVEDIKKKYVNVRIIQFLTLIEGVKSNKTIVTNNLATLTDDKKTLYFANSVCKIPMIRGNLKAINSAFVSKDIIPTYKLYSDEDKSMHNAIKKRRNDESN